MVDTTAPSEGKFAFTSHIAGDHDICLSSHPHDSHSYHTSGDHPQIRLHLDIIIGEAKPDNTAADRSHITDLAGRVKNLNDKLKDIRKEQQYQREREALFRDESEKTNARAVVYSAIQGVVLVAACVWQLRTLRVSQGIAELQRFRVSLTDVSHFLCVSLTGFLLREEVQLNTLVLLSHTR